ncbi:MAG: site-2 protease family protein [Candidatus Moranbacteria bacterium]|nr:site-2 protease family protein [Candidatus Moranbacteria bacterium]
MPQEIVLIAFYIATLIYSVIVHEISHGVVALWLGDMTAKYAGRLTLNPMKHIDPFGSVILPALLIFSTGFAFGWAKPVPYNPYNLRNQKWGPVLVALAGPATNFLIALGATLIALLMPIGSLAKADIISRFYAVIGGRGSFMESFQLFGEALSGSFGAVIFGLLLLIIFWNVILGCFNLLPIPPLDGSKLLYMLFRIPERIELLLEQYGLFLLFIIIFFFSYPISLFIYTTLGFFIGILV